jgi:hypothetical protein
VTSAFDDQMLRMNLFSLGVFIELVVRAGVFAMYTRDF